MKKLLSLILCLFLLSGFTIQDMQRILASKKSSSALWGGAASGILDANCMGAWYMNGTSKNTETDRSGNGNTLTDSNTCEQSATVPAGYSGNSRDFEESQGADKLHCADGTELDINGVDATISFGCWFKVEDIAVRDYQVIMGKGDLAGDGNEQYLVYTLERDVNKFCIKCGISGNGTSYTFEQTTGQYDEGTWYHVIVISDDVEISIYMNGALANTPSAHTSGIANGGEEFVIGARSDADREFDGLIDEAIVFDRAITTAEVIDLYTNGISGNTGQSD